MESLTSFGGFLGEANSDSLIKSILLSGVFGLVVFFRWCYVVTHAATLRKIPYRWSYIVVPMACVALFIPVLRFWGARSIRQDPSDLVFLVGAGAVFLILTAWFLRWVNFFPLQDGLEGGNGAAAIVFLGSIVGLTVIYAGASIGEGAAEEQNFFCAGVGAVGWFSLWIIMESFSRASTAINCDRDKASATRLAGLLAANGLILGRALAGRWEGAGATIHDFVHGSWPALLITLVAIVFQRSWRPMPACADPPWIRRGLIPAGCFIAAAIVHLIIIGPWK